MSVFANQLGKRQMQHTVVLSEPVKRVIVSPDGHDGACLACMYHTGQAELFHLDEVIRIPIDRLVFTQCFRKYFISQ